MKLWNLLNEFKKDYQIIDLSHPVTPTTPHWSGFDGLKTRELYNFKEHRFSAIEYTIASQYATHIDAPGHFNEGGRLLHELDLADNFLPLVVIDKSKEANENPEYVLYKKDIITFEKEYGEIPEGAFVALRTDWSKRTENFDNIDENDIAHFPGWSIEACEYLIKERKVKAIGHETADTDASVLSRESGFLDVETYVLSQDIYQVELLKNLDKLPTTGAVIIVSYPNIIDAPGFTARCVAICEK